MKKYISILKQFLRFQKPDNLKVVAYCIVTAATFWFFSALNKQYDATVKFPVKWEFDPSKYIVVDELPEAIQMNVSGLGWNLLRANSGLGLTPIILRLTDPVSKKRLPASYFENQIAEELDQLHLNYLIEDSLHFNIDFRISQTFPIYIDSVGIDLEEGYRITSRIHYDTTLVEIEGPKELLQLMSKDTFWVHVEESKIDDNFEGEVPIVVENEDLMIARPSLIKASFKVDKFIDREIQVPVAMLNFENKPKIYLADTLVMVHYLVQEKLQDSVRAESFIIEANFKNINKKDSTILLKLVSSPNNVLQPSLTFPQIKVYYNE